MTDVSSAKENFVRAVYDSIPKGTILCLFILWLALKRVAMKCLIKTYSKVWGWIVLEDKASDVYSEDVAQELAEMGRCRITY